LSAARGHPRFGLGRLNLVSNLISLGGVLALPYAGGVRRACLLLLRTDQPADVATAALSVFDRLCEARVPAETMRPAELERELQEAKTRSTGQYTKKGSRPRGSLFKTLGLVLQAYPRSFDEKVRRGLHFHEAVEICSELTIPPQSTWDVLDALVASMHAEWGSAKDKQDLAASNPVIDGCLRGAFYLLRAHPDVLVNPRVSARHCDEPRAEVSSGVPSFPDVSTLATPPHTARAVCAPLTDLWDTLLRALAAGHAVTRRALASAAAAAAPASAGRASLDIPEAAHLFLAKACFLVCGLHHGAPTGSSCLCCSAPSTSLAASACAGLGPPAVLAVLRVIAQQLCMRPRHDEAATSLFEWCVADVLEPMLQVRAPCVGGWGVRASCSTFPSPLTGRSGR